MNSFHPTPGAVLNGIQDKSGTTPEVPRIEVPTFLTHVWAYAQKGSALPQIIEGGEAAALYGAETFNEKSKYANHQTVLANTILGTATKIVLHRVVPNDAETSRLRLFAAVGDMPTATESNVFIEGTVVTNGGNTITVPTGFTGLSSSTGSGARTIELGGVSINVLDVNTVITLPSGKIINVAAGATATWDGTTITLVQTLPASKGIMWSVEPIASGNQIGSALNDAPATVNVALAGGTATMTRYPIMDFESSSVGGYGDHTGFRLSSLSVDDIMNSSLERDGRWEFNLSLISRVDETTSPQIVPTTDGDRVIRCSFDDGETAIETMMTTPYLNNESFNEVPGPIGAVYRYKANFDLLLGDAYAGLTAADPVTYPALASGADAPKHINVLTGTDYSGINYPGLSIVSELYSGIEFNEYRNNYLQGGSDGTMSDTLFSDAVKGIATGINTSEWDYLNSAKWPTSAFVDTGFAFDTKIAMLAAIAERKDVGIILATQDITMPQNSKTQDRSAAIALQTAARLTPESALHGTGACRVAIVGQSGHLVNSNFKGLMPLSLELAKKCAVFMGASSGIWKSGKGFDKTGNKLITMFDPKTVKGTYSPHGARVKDWDAGLVWAQDYNLKSLFFPQVQSVYADATSVLNPFLNIWIFIEAEKEAERVWRMFTGDTELTKEQFIEQSDRELTERLRASRFDGRPNVFVRTHFTDGDDSRGYSWSTTIQIEVGNMKTLNVINLESGRYGQFA